MPPLGISNLTARRYIMGRQGLWPGRRWRGLPGAEKAMRAMEHLQLDPLNVVARAHDLMLQSRVIDYRPDDWAILTYERRQFFEWGGWLAVRPLEEMPYWRVLMRRERNAPRMQAIATEHGAAIEEMRAVLRDRAEVSNRDFAMTARTRVNSYRGSKDSALALHYLWRIGEAMVARRDRFERVYASTESVVPGATAHEAADDDADDFFLRKMVAAQGLAQFTGVQWVLERPVTAAEIATWRAGRVASGDLLEVTVAGWKGPRWAPGGDREVLETIEAGDVPQAWQPLDTNTDEEATFLSPLDPVSARGRAKPLFDFDYTWEVYTPPAKRRFGYYVLPILWGDRLVGRFDGRLDRAKRTLVLDGLWFEDDATATDAAFADALDRAMIRYLGFLGADRIEAKAVKATRIRRRLESLTPEPGSPAPPSRCRPGR